MLVLLEINSLAHYHRRLLIIRERRCNAFFIELDSMHESLFKIDSISFSNLSQLILNLILLYLIKLLPLQPFLLSSSLLLQILKELINSILPLFMFPLNPLSFLFLPLILAEPPNYSPLKRPLPVQLGRMLLNQHLLLLPLILFLLPLRHSVHLETPPLPEVHGLALECMHLLNR
jgi:hypothetical protein